MMQRRSFFASIVKLGGCSFIAGSSFLSEGKTLSSLPNIVLVMADDQGWGDTGYYNPDRVNTPNLDSMEGVALRFDRFYSAGPVCSPTRASVLTGRHPNRCNVLNHGHSIRPQEITLATQLKRAGYATGHFGKWHIGSVQKTSPTSPSALGFDEWLSSPNYFDRNPLMSKKGEVVRLRGESEDITIDAAIDFIREQSRKKTPFLAAVWFANPHRPHVSLRNFEKPYVNRKDKGYLAEITAMDRAFGRLRNELQRLGLRQNTLVWYTSDNGGLCSASSGCRGSKGVIYEGGLRVPALVEWPAVIKTARSTDVCCCTCDIYPTLLDIVGVKPPPDRNLDGVSLLPIIKAENIDHPPIGFWDMKVEGRNTHSERILKQIRSRGDVEKLVSTGKEGSGADKIVKEWPVKHRGHAAWLDWPWKLHRISVGEDEKLELYNLEDDPSEKFNLADSQTRKALRMLAALKEWQESVIASLNGEDYSGLP